MRYCHECGAEVAPEDIFCLYCGITLQPVSSVSKKNNDDSISTGDLPEDKLAASEIATQTSSADLLTVTQTTDSPTTDLPEDLSKQAVTAPDFDDFKNLSLEDQNPLALPKSGDLQAIQDNQTPAAPLNPSDSAFTWENLSADLPKNTPDIFAQTQSEKLEIVADVANDNDQVHQPIIEETLVKTAPEKIEAKSNLLDEDLQPTIISQGSNLLLPDEEKPLVISAPKTNEQPVVFSNEKTANTDSAKSEVSNAPQSVDFAGTINSEISQPEKFQEVGGAIANTSLSEPIPVKPSVANATNASATITPRQTESNLPQETPGSKSPKLKPLDAGTMLNNRYKIVRRIGGGGMGAVYLAEDQNLGGVLRAVKEMIQAYVDESQQEKAVADFRRESVLLTQLEHSSIPTIYDYFFDEAKGRFYLVMKYIAGGDLAARLRAAPESKLDEGSVTTWAIQIADVLDYLHNRQPPIVYRDLKPSNIMLDGSNNKAMLIDFGIARWVNKEEKGVTAVGTMGYAPPELFAGNAEPRSDIYSLGATMFHLLTGADPQSNPLLIFDFTKNPRPRQINLMLSVEMEDILLRSVEYNSGLRFESAEKMRNELQAHLEKLKAGRLTFERSSHNLAQVMPIPAQAPPSVPFASQPAVNMVFCGFCGEKIIATDMFCAYCGAPQASAPPVGSSSAAAPQQQPLAPSGGGSKSSQQMQQTMMSQPPQLGNITARLVVLGTSELDAPLFKLEKENNLVGREDRRANIFPEIDLSKFDNKAQVSRRHARIWREGSAYMIEDLKSSNGTLLITDDNQSVRLQANQPHVLQHGDKLKLGETTLRFYVN